MKKILLLTLTILPLLLLAQEETIYRLDDDFRITEAKKYSYTRKVIKENDQWAFTDYTRKGELLQKGYFLDEKFYVRTGHYAFFWDGRKLYEGNYGYNNPIGTWYFYDRSGVVEDSLHYPDPADYKNPPPVLTDSAKKALDSMIAYGNKYGIESEFQGGAKGWYQYLIKTLRFPRPAMETMGAFKKACVVQFIVCSDGTVCDVETITSVHPLLDLQAVNAIRKGPVWKPAELDGKKVKSLKRQPIVFGLEEK